MSSETAETVKEIIEPVLSDLGFELVAVELRRERVGLVLRVVIYKEGGVSLEDCTAVSREVGYLLEVDDPIGSAYNLEVSSPGLDRPLKTPRDFERNIGKKVKVVFADDAGQEKKITGTIEALEGEDTLYIKTGNEDLKINLAHIIKALLVIEF